jgi:predicted nucleic acid-binding protein
VRYFDTSYLVRCYLEDEGWEKVRALAEEEAVACCALGHAEAASAFHRKLREAALTPEQYEEVCLQFRDDCSDGLWKWLPVDAGMAGRVASKYAMLPSTVFIRAADALHLQCAQENGFSVAYSHDRQLLAAAPQFWLVGTDII